MSRVNRRVKRNMERFAKARGRREKAIANKAFIDGTTVGATFMRDKIVNAARDLNYEEEQIVSEAT